VFIQTAAEHIVGDVESTVYDRNTSGPNWPTIAIIVTTAATSYTLYRLADSHFANPTKPPRFGEASHQASLAGVYLPIIAPIGFFGVGLFHERGSPDRLAIWATAEELAEAVVLQAVTQLSLKFAVHRSTGLPGIKNSFPSGHSAALFATAGVLALRYPWYIGIPSLATATALSLARLDVHAHYPSDLAAGAGIGLLFAVAVHGYHNWIRDNPTSTSSVLPLAADATYGLQWQTLF
jgi:membrane-associated phospholipid phosphatase